MKLASELSVVLELSTESLGRSHLYAPSTCSLGCCTTSILEILRRCQAPTDEMKQHLDDYLNNELVDDQRQVIKAKAFSVFCNMCAARAPSDTVECAHVLMRSSEEDCEAAWLLEQGLDEFMIQQAIAERGSQDVSLSSSQTPSNSASRGASDPLSAYHEPQRARRSGRDRPDQPRPRAGGCLGSSRGVAGQPAPTG